MWIDIIMSILVVSTHMANMRSNYHFPIFLYALENTRKMAQSCQQISGFRLIRIGLFCVFQHTCHINSNFLVRIQKHNRGMGMRLIADLCTHT